MDYAQAPHVNDATMIEEFGDLYYHRGLGYADEGLVEGIDWDPNGLSLSGEVAGSRGRDYTTTVYFAEIAPGLLEISYTECSCPMESDCKHVVALLLTANRATRPALVKNKVVTMRPPAGLWPSATAEEVVQRKPAPPPPLPAWEVKARSALKPDRALWASDLYAYSTRYAAPTMKRTPLALQLEAISQDIQFHGRYVHPSSDPWDFQGKKRNSIHLRPMVQGERGKWNLSKISWDALDGVPNGMNPVGFDPRQERWFRTLLSLYPGSSGYGMRYLHMKLENFDNPLVWHLLRSAEDLGIPLLNASTMTQVSFHESASMDLVAEDTSDGSLVIEPRAIVDGESIKASALTALGTPIHGIAWSQDVPAGARGTLKPSIHLAPLEAPATTVTQLLTDFQSSLEIPVEDRDRFLAEYFPQIARNNTVIATDSRVLLPVPPPPLLVASIGIHDFVPPGGTIAEAVSVAVSWHWEYVCGNTVNIHDLDSFVGPERDRHTEDQILASIAEALEPLTGVQGLDTAGGRLIGLPAARFINEAVPLLQTLANVRVDTEYDEAPYKRLTQTPQVSIATTETDQIDWFDLRVSINIDSVDIPFTPLFVALANGEEHLMLPTGEYFLLDQPEFQILRRLIEEARLLNDSGGPLRISRFQADLWDEFTRLAVSAEQAEAWNTSVRGLLDLTTVEATPVPETIEADLRPYQQAGFSWLAFLYDHGLGGVLADDMGLGKTLQTIALFEHARTHGNSCPFLVVAPTSVVGNWVTEIQRFAPGLRVAYLDQTFKKSGQDLGDVVIDVDVLVISYALFRIDQDEYAAREFAGLILDEAQFVKNPAAKASQYARAFKTRFKLAITGTPIENNLMELWSLFAITAPGLFPAAKSFTAYYRKPIEKDGDKERLAQLRRRIKPLMLRRTKEVVAKDLPPKQEQILEIELSPKHHVIYQRHLQRERQKVLGLLADMSKNRFAIFKSLTTLRMLSLDASLIDEKYEGTPSSKLDHLFEQLGDILAEGHRSLIFSQFTRYLRKVAARLDEAGIPYVYLDGSTRNRTELISTFKEGHAPLFLISLKAGGFGLNLTEADYCFMLDPWWNPATENQAIDRTHRIGQTKNVMVYRLVAKNTIEEKVMALKEKKAKLFASVMDDDATFSAELTTEDIRSLFE